MKRVLVLMLFSLNAHAGYKVKVYDHTDTVKVFLAETACPVKSLKGKSATVQRYDGAYIRGCWYDDPSNKNNYRIDWDNPKAPGDFAVIEKSKFKDTEVPD